MAPRLELLNVRIEDTKMLPCSKKKNQTCFIWLAYQPLKEYNFYFFKDSTTYQLGDLNKVAAKFVEAQLQLLIGMSLLRAVGPSAQGSVSP